MLTATSILTMGVDHRFDDALEKDIKPALERVFSGPEPLCVAFESRVPELFGLKMNMARQLLQEGFDWDEGLEKASELAQNLTRQIAAAGNSLLADNLSFASWVGIDVTRSLLASFELRSLSGGELHVVTSMTFDDFRTLILLEPLPTAVRHRLIDITKVATVLDFATLSAFFCFQGGLTAPASRLEELSLCLRDWAQSYGALAQELGIWRPKVLHEAHWVKVNEEDIEEEGELAEAGIEDYLEGILRHERSS